MPLLSLCQPRSLHPFQIALLDRTWENSTPAPSLAPDPQEACVTLVRAHSRNAIGPRAAECPDQCSKTALPWPPDFHIHSLLYLFQVSPGLFAPSSGNMTQSCPGGHFEAPSIDLGSKLAASHLTTQVERGIFHLIISNFSPKSSLRWALPLTVCSLLTPWSGWGFKEFQESQTIFFADFQRAIWPLTWDFTFVVSCGSWFHVYSILLPSQNFIFNNSLHFKNHSIPPRNSQFTSQHAAGLPRQLESQGNGVWSCRKWKSLSLVQFFETPWPEHWSG